MTNEMQSIRDDLAFLRALAADDGPLPYMTGLQFFIPGLLFSAVAMLSWASMRGLISLPGRVADQLGLWSAVAYIPILIALVLMSRRPSPGTAMRAMLGAWSGMGLTTLSVLGVIFIAGARLHVPEMWQVWTSVCFSLWGMAWWAFAVFRRSPGWFIVAGGSLLTGLINASLIGTPEVLLGCGLGILCWLGGPGLAIILRARPRA